MNSRPMIWRVLVILFLLAPVARAEVVIFAAASLKEPVDQIFAGRDDVIMSYGGSGMLARQVALGAPADIVLLANAAWMDVLIEAGHVMPETVRDFASNRMVLIGPAGADPVQLEASAIDQALGQGRLATGLTQAVPAGIYGREALVALGLWDTVADRLAEVDSVRAALVLVARGQAPLGIVYQTDLRISDAVQPLAVFPTVSHAPIRYTGALTVGSKAEAAGVLDAILSDAGQATFAAAGFLPPATFAHD
ncbi:MAG: molybdate ABC transporter substrate-binding protein [Pseudomonadota bacterium]